MLVRKQRQKRMVQAARITMILVATCLSGCGGLSMFGTDIGSGASRPVAGTPANSSAAPTTASSNAATSASNSLFARAAETNTVSRSSDLIASLVNFSSATGEAGGSAQAVPPAAEKAMPQPRGRAYLFRGMVGLIYSRGMDKLAERINRIGVPTSVNTYLMWRPVAAAAISDYSRDPEPIILIGHSMGGDSVVAFAETLNAAAIPVSLLVTYDPTRIADDVPPNVRRYINIYQSHSIMGGGRVTAGHGFHGHYASVDLADHGEIIHINIEKTDSVQDQLVAKIARLAATPAVGGGEAVPIHYVVPASATIELWDSGMPVVAQAGDTLQKLAVQYHAPVWAIAQINDMAEHTTITAGQRIIVPRNLMPMAATATSAISAYAAPAR
jgi:LysM repeat protein